MKKILALCLVAILGLALVGCNNNNDVIDDGNNPPVQDNQNQGNENLGENSGEDNQDNEQDEIIDDINSASNVMTELITKANIQVNAPMQDVIPAEMSEAYIGLNSGDFESYVTDSVFYESMISPANQSFCIIKVNDLTKVEELKQKIFDNCNPRKWVCMTAERVVVMDSGEYIMLAMASKDNCDTLITTFSEHFDKNVGPVLDKTIEENINTEDVDGGMAL